MYREASLSVSSSHKQVLWVRHFAAAGSGKLTNSIKPSHAFTAMRPSWGETHPFNASVRYRQNQTAEDNLI